MGTRIFMKAKGNSMAIRAMSLGALWQHQVLLQDNLTKNDGKYSYPYLTEKNRTLKIETHTWPLLSNPGSKLNLNHVTEYVLLNVVNILLFVLEGMGEFIHF